MQFYDPDENLIYCYHGIKGNRQSREQRPQRVAVKLRHYQRMNGMPLMVHQTYGLLAIRAFSKIKR